MLLGLLGDRCKVWGADLWWRILSRWRTFARHHSSTKEMETTPLQPPDSGNSVVSPKRSLGKAPWVMRDSTQIFPITNDCCPSNHTVMLLGLLIDSCEVWGADLWWRTLGWGAIFRQSLVHKGGRQATICVGSGWSQWDMYVLCSIYIYIYNTYYVL